MRRENRSSRDVVGNKFPNRSVQRRKQEGIEDALIEESSSIEVDNMASLMLKKDKKLSPGLDRTKCRDTQIS
jgi:hypothetical protein